MKTINEMKNNEYEKSRKLKEIAFGIDYEKAKEIRKEQKNSYNKWLFLKGLGKAMEGNK